MSLSPDTFHEFAIPPTDMFDANGVLTITFANPNDTALRSSRSKTEMEVLYPEAGFSTQLCARAGGKVIFCWMALIAALGLMAASYLSFPVASFFALAMMLGGPEQQHTDGIRGVRISRGRQRRDGPSRSIPLWTWF